MGVYVEMDAFGPNPLRAGESLITTVIEPFSTDQLRTIGPVDHLVTRRGNSVAAGSCWRDLLKQLETTSIAAEQDSAAALSGAHDVLLRVAAGFCWRDRVGWDG